MVARNGPCRRCDGARCDARCAEAGASTVGLGVNCESRRSGAVLRQPQAAAAFAPLHTPAARVIVRCALQRFAGLPRGAYFDTSFHAGLPDVARTLPIAEALRPQGLQRCKFHGLSPASVVRQLGIALPQRRVIAHFGNAVSITAAKGGPSIDTSMAPTPAGGGTIGTRTGDLYPGALVHLAREQQFDAARLERWIDRHSGLLGIAGGGSDIWRQTLRTAR